MAQLPGGHFAGWQAAGSLGSKAGATDLTSRVRLVPRSGFEEWLDDQLAGDHRDALSDAEQDGLPLLLQYIFNLPPETANHPPASAGDPEPFGVPQLVLPSPQGDGELTYVRVKNDPRVSTTVEWSGDLEQWTTAVGESVVVSGGTTHELVKTPATNGANAKWWRVRAEYQAN